jgi:choline dehydrogenase
MSQMAGEFDFVVVGAGSAGCSLAAKLSESGLYSVALLEAGVDDPWIWLRIPAGVAHIVRGERSVWRFYTEPELQMKSRRIFWPRGKVLGGSSTVNGMIWSHGDPKEFDSWREDLGLYDWGASDVKPFFRNLESYAQGDQRIRGTHGPVHITEYSPKLPLMHDFVTACNTAGIPINPDYNGDDYEGVGFLQFNTKRGWRFGAREAYLKSIKNRQSLKVFQGALAQRVVIENKRAKGVVFLQDNNTFTIHARKEVILCAGALQSPQLLELSGIGQPELLQSLGIPVVHAAINVGENLHDHLHTRVNFEVRGVATLNQIMPSFWRKGLMALRWFGMGDGLMSVSGQTIHALAKVSPESSRVEVKLQLHWLSSPDARDPKKLILDPFPGVSIGTFPLRPRSRGHVHIINADVRTHPRMIANYLDHPDDRTHTVAALRMARRIMSQPAMSKWVVREDRPGDSAVTDDELLDYVRTIGQTSYHPVGSCRMGVDDASVVDPELRVRGIEALRVADASVFPTMPSSNTNAASMMVGERAAHFILGKSDSPLL